mgnify:FL=1
MLNLKIQENRQFSTSYLKCRFDLPMTQSNLVLSAVLSTMQLRLTGHFKNMAAQAKGLQSLYDTRLDTDFRVTGDRLFLDYDFEFVEPDEILDPDYLFSQICELFFDLIKKPRFTQPLLDLIKKQLIEQYLDLSADPQFVASDHFLKRLYPNHPEFSNLKFPSASEIAQVDLKRVQDFELSLSQTPACFVGHLRNPNGADLISPHLDWPGFSLPLAVPQIMFPSVSDVPITQEDTMPELAQAQLLLGWRYPQGMVLDELRVVSCVLAAYLSLSDKSVLFHRIREKMSAVYAIDAKNDDLNGILMIQAGLDQEKLPAVDQAIRDEIHRLQDGDLDVALFKEVKAQLIRQYLELQDNQQDLVEVACHGFFTKVTAQQWLNRIKRLSTNQMIDFVKRLELVEDYKLR